MHLGERCEEWRLLLTMFLVCLLKHRLVLQQLLNLCKQRLFLIVVMRLDKLVPDQRISDEVGLVVVEKVGGLLIDGVVAAEDRVVEEGHVGSTRGKDVGLFGLELRRRDELHRTIGPGLGGCDRSHIVGCATEEKANDHKRDGE